MSLNNLRMLVRALRKKEPIEAFDHIRNSAPVGDGKESTPGELRPDEDNSIRQQRNGKIISS
jgi:hypothetical protein